VWNVSDSPSRLMPTAMHFLRRQYWQRFLLIRRMLHCWFLVHGRYWIFCWMLRRKKPCESPTKPSSIWPSLSDEDPDEQSVPERGAARSHSHKHPINSLRLRKIEIARLSEQICESLSRSTIISLGTCSWARNWWRYLGESILYKSGRSSLATHVSHYVSHV